MKIQYLARSILAVIFFLLTACGSSGSDSASLSNSSARVQINIDASEERALSSLNQPRVQSRAASFSEISRLSIVILSAIDDSVVDTATLNSEGETSAIFVLNPGSYIIQVQGFDSSGQLIFEGEDFIQDLQAGSNRSVDLTLVAVVIVSVDAGDDQTFLIPDTLDLLSNDLTATITTSNTIASIAWSQLSGSPTVNFIDSTSQNTSYEYSSVGLSGTHSIVLLITVEDSEGNIATDTVTHTFIIEQASAAIVIVNTQADRDIKSAARATQQLVSITSTIAASNSIASIEWSQLSGSPTAIFQDNSLQDPTYLFNTIEVVGATSSIVLLITVEDSEGNIGTDTVTHTFIKNIPPVAVAGLDASFFIVDNQQTLTIALDGSQSFDVDSLLGVGLGFHWTQISQDIGITISDAFAETTTIVIPPATLQNLIETETVVFNLNVAEGNGDDSNDTVTITFIPDLLPMGDFAGPDRTETLSVALGMTATIALEGLVMGGTQIWTFTGQSGIGSIPLMGDTATVLTNGNGSATFTFDPGLLEFPSEDLFFELSVTNSSGDTVTDTVTITIFQNSPPIADAGTSQNLLLDISSIELGEAAFDLDASDSFDPDGDPLTYFWEQISDPTSPGFTFNPAPTVLDMNINQTGNYQSDFIFNITETFMLTVTDTSGISATDTVVITIFTN